MIEIRLRQLMKDRGLGVVELAARAQVNTTQIYNLMREPDRVHIKTLDRVCTALGVTPCEVLIHMPETSLDAASDNAGIATDAAH